MTIDTGDLGSELSRLCGRWRELDPVSDAELAVDGCVPAYWCEPATPEELGLIVRLANERGAAVLPRGGGTRMALGNPPRSADILISTRGLNQIIEYEPADLTITVQAGLALAALQEHLRVNRQLLALDPACADRATVGGVVASNACGPLRLQYGSARDLVIGTRVANADGVLTKAGGRVVKNVAGYDLNKLYTGSLGTVGVIVELSFKLHPLPQSQGTVVAAFSELEAAEAVVRRVMRSPLGPAALEVFDVRAARLLPSLPAVPEGGCGLAVLVGGFERSVQRVCDELAALCAPTGQAEVLEDGPDTREVWETIRSLSDASDASAPLLRLSVPPSRSLEALGRLRELSRGLRQVPLLHAHAGLGLAYARFPSDEWSDQDLDGLARLVREARAYAVQREGSLVVESGPPGLKQRVDAWGEVGPALKLMRRIKEQLDPKSSLNPGRYVGGI